MEDLVHYLPDIQPTVTPSEAVATLAGYIAALNAIPMTPCNPDDPMQSSEHNPRRIRCGAKKRDGTPCQAWAMPNGRCRMHGGKSRKGADHPQIKSGRYSKDLPTRLQQRFAEALADETLLNLSVEAALIDTRIGEIIATLHSGGAGALWEALQQAAQAAQRASKNPDRARQHLGDLFRLIQQGTEEQARWAEITDLVEQKRKIVETERKRLRDADLIITVQQLNVVLAFILDSIRRHVADHDARSAIKRDFDTFLAGPLQSRPHPVA